MSRSLCVTHRHVRHTNATNVRTERVHVCAVYARTHAHRGAGRRERLDLDHVAIEAVLFRARVRYRYFRIGRVPIVHVTELDRSRNEDGSSTQGV